MYTIWVLFPGIADFKKNVLLELKIILENYKK